MGSNPIVSTSLFNDLAESTILGFFYCVTFCVSSEGTIEVADCLRAVVFAEVGVALGHRQTLMTEDFLHYFDIGSGHHEMAGLDLNSFTSTFRHFDRITGTGAWSRS